MQETAAASYIPLPGNEAVLVHLDHVPYVSAGLANNRFGQVFLAASATKTAREEQRQLGTESQEGWEFAAVSSDAARKIGRPAVYVAVAVPMNNGTERGF